MPFWKFQPWKPNWVLKKCADSVGINYGRIPRCVESRKVTITCWKYSRFPRGAFLCLPAVNFSSLLLRLSPVCAVIPPEQERGAQHSLQRRVFGFVGVWSQWRFSLLGSGEILHTGAGQTALHPCKSTGTNTESLQFQDKWSLLLTYSSPREYEERNNHKGKRLPIKE